MILELLALYVRIIVLSLPLFIAIFFFTWWMRGRGFGEFAALLPRPIFRRRPRPDGAGRPESGDEPNE